MCLKWWKFIHPNGGNRIWFRLADGILLKVTEPNALSGVDDTCLPPAAEHIVKASTSIYFILVFMLTIPFYILGASSAKLPGLPFLPVNTLMVLVPVLVALFLTYWQHGGRGAVTLLKSPFTYEQNLGAIWILIALLFMPAVCLLEFGILRLVGSKVPFPQIGIGQLLFYFIVFFIGAVGEELGWQGYAYPSLRNSHTVFDSAVILGIIWALWHVVPFVQMGRTTNWIIWHELSTVIIRIIIVWLFENTRKSILIAVLFHTMFNVSWTMFPVAGSFPISGSFYDPFITFLILAFPLSAIIAWWGPEMNHGENPR